MHIFFQRSAMQPKPKKIKNKGQKRSSLAGNRTRGGRVRADRVTDYTTRDQLNDGEKFWFLTLPFMHFVQKGPKSHEAVGNLPKEIRQRGNNFLGGEENCWLRNTLPSLAREHRDVLNSFKYSNDVHYLRINFLGLTEFV